MRSDHVDLCEAIMRTLPPFRVKHLRDREWKLLWATFRQEREEEPAVRALLDKIVARARTREISGQRPEPKLPWPFGGHRARARVPVVASPAPRKNREIPSPPEEPPGAEEVQEGAPVADVIHVSRSHEPVGPRAWVSKRIEPSFASEIEELFRNL
jgi:hypothetical protein